MPNKDSLAQFRTIPGNVLSKKAAHTPPTNIDVSSNTINI